MVKPLVAAVALLLCGPEVFAQTPPQPTYSCAGVPHRAFDFWLGRWDAFVTGTKHLAGRSVIEAHDDGCVVTEEWTSVGGEPFSGRSLNAFDSTTGKWVQVWMDSVGEVTRYGGGPTAGGVMVLTAPDEVRPGRPAKAHLRMTFTPNADGSVRQHGERSTDGGATWTTAYDFTYRRAP